MEEEKEDKVDWNEVVQNIGKIKPYTTLIIILCLILLSGLLGYVRGYSEAFQGQEKYYETYEGRYCICTEQMTFSIDRTIDIPEFEYPLEKIK